MIESPLGTYTLNFISLRIFITISLVWDEVWGSILPVFQAIESNIGFNGTLTSINNLTEALSGGNATQIIDLSNFLPDSITGFVHVTLS